MSIFEGFMETSAKLADQAAKKAGEVVDIGKKKVSKLALENDLAKAQRQLGALVYVMHKTNEQNDELLAQYIKDVADIELELSEYKEDDEDIEPSIDTRKACATCGSVLEGDDKFCKICGTPQE